jgi:hypothetical protein
MFKRVHRKGVSGFRFRGATVVDRREKSTPSKRLPLTPHFGTAHRRVDAFTDRIPPDRIQSGHLWMAAVYRFDTLYGF